MSTPQRPSLMSNEVPSTRLWWKWRICVSHCQVSWLGPRRMRCTCQWMAAVPSWCIPKNHETNENCDIIDFWTSLSIENYPKLSKIALSVLTIPCGNASVERVFSDLNDLLTKKRKRLSEVSVDSCLLINGFLKQTDQTRVTYPIEKSLISAGFNAHASYLKRLKEMKKEDEEKERELTYSQKTNKRTNWDWNQATEVKEQNLTKR